MNYSKPEIASLKSASFVVRGMTVKVCSCADVLTHILASNPAYEADE
jgi:hypothetical protein